MMFGGIARIRMAGRLLCSVAASLMLATPVVSANAQNAAREGLETEVDQNSAAGVVEIKLDWGFTVYTARLSEDRFDDTLLFRASLENSRVWVAAISKEIWRPNRHIVFGLEGQLAKHAGPVQRHWEINGLGTLRWLTFPWDRHIDTSAAVGLGLSYATDLPEFEVQDNGTSNRWLAYALVELTAILPSIPKWQFVVRVHHRSAIFGLFEDNLKGGSNAVGVGMKYRW